MASEGRIIDNDAADRLYAQGYTVFIIRQDSDGWYYGHVSCPGRPGDQFASEPTELQAIDAVRAVYHGAFQYYTS